MKFFQISSVHLSVFSGKKVCRAQWNYGGNPRVPCWRSPWTPLMIDPCPLSAAGLKISRRYRPIWFPERARNSTGRVVLMWVMCGVWCQCAHGIAPLAADRMHAVRDGDYQKLPSCMYRSNGPADLNLWLAPPCVIAPFFILSLSQFPMYVHPRRR